MAEFQLLIKNTPGSIIEGRLTKKGRIEYLFRAFGGIAMLFIEVKYRLASSKEYLDAVAQVIAEADGPSPPVPALRRLLPVLTSHPQHVTTSTSKTT